MSRLYFAWLGSGRTKRAHVGPLGRNLDQAARAGLPVASGAVLLDELFRLCVEHDLVEVANGRVFCTDPASLHATIFESLRLPTFDRPLTIRPVAPEAAGATPVAETPCPDVDSRDASQLARAVSAAWSALELAGATRHDVLLHETIPAAQCGTAQSRQVDEYDQVGLSAGPGDSTADNAIPSLSKLSGWRLPDSSLPPHLRRLQMLLRGVRRTMGPGDWTITWADDGDICWLVDLRELPAVQD